jgi:putative ABC transport system ATP-binding protein
MSSPILRVEHLTQVYSSGARELTVLDDVSFVLEVGSTCAVVGPSGSGKTTLLSLCAGLDRPTRGRVELCGVHLGSQDEDALARLRSERVGFVFQSFQLIPTLTALENVMVPLELQGRAGARAAARARLEQVGLRDRAEHYPAQLSGGEQQRVALARAFVHGPAVLFADEPTGNLDEENAERVRQLLFEMNEEAGTTLVLVTHNEELARRTGRILTLRAGRLAAESPQRAVERE